MMLSARDVDFMKNCLADVHDEGQPYMYKVYLSTVKGDKASGVTDKNNYLDVSYTGPIEELSLEYIQSTGGIFKAGDIQVTVDRDKVSEKDRIVVDGDWFQPMEKKRIFIGGHLGFLVRCTKVPAEV